MWFDIPVLAVDSGPNRAIAGGAAILMHDTSDLLAVAALADFLGKDVRLREAVIAAQRRKRVSADEVQHIP
jgi:hypothetical protein